MLCEWYRAPCTPPPYGAGTTMRQFQSPAERYRTRAASEPLAWEHRTGVVEAYPKRLVLGGRRGRSPVQGLPPPPHPDPGHGGRGGLVRSDRDEPEQHTRTDLRGLQCLPRLDVPPQPPTLCLWAWMRSTGSGVLHTRRRRELFLLGRLALLGPDRLHA